MVFPPGHHQEIRKLRNRRPREKWFMAFGSLVTIIIIGLVIFSMTTHQKHSGNGCIDFNYLTMIGGAEMYQCGERARTMCASPAPKNDPDPGFYKDMDAACREAHLSIATG